MPGRTSATSPRVCPNLQLFLEGKQTAEQTLKKAQDHGDKLLTQNN